MAAADRSIDRPNDVIYESAAIMAACIISGSHCSDGRQWVAASPHFALSQHVIDRQKPISLSRKFIAASERRSEAEPSSSYTARDAAVSRNRNDDFCRRGSGDGSDKVMNEPRDSRAIRAFDSGSNRSQFGELHFFDRRNFELH